jgi:cytochrome c-type biogenesis protein CcmE
MSPIIPTPTQVHINRFNKLVRHNTNKMKKRANTGAIVTGLVSLAAMTAIGATFLANASPYVDVKQALRGGGDNMHLAGNILKDTVHSDVTASTLSFTIKDSKGDTLPVEYSGEAISNMGEADRVVAIGGVQGGKFHAHKLLIKCPSKYGDAATKQVGATQTAANQGGAGARTSY